MNSGFVSEWRKWDFYVHIPYSVLNHPFGLNADDPTDFDLYVLTLFTQAVEKDVWALVSPTISRLTATIEFTTATSANPIN